MRTSSIQTIWKKDSLSNLCNFLFDRVNEIDTGENEYSLTFQGWGKAIGHFRTMINLTKRNGQVIALVGAVVIWTKRSECDR